MPCNSDYLNPSEIEKNLSVVYGLLDELESGVLPSNFGDGYDKRIYNKHLPKQHLDKKVEELCAKLQNTDVSRYSLEMQMWWRDHQKADKERLKNEKQSVIHTNTETKDGVKYTTHYVNRPIGPGDPQGASIGECIDSVNRITEIVTYVYQSK